MMVSDATQTNFQHTAISDLPKWQVHGVLPSTFVQKNSRALGKLSGLTSSGLGVSAPRTNPRSGELLFCEAVRLTREWHVPSAGSQYPTQWSTAASIGHFSPSIWGNNTTPPSPHPPNSKLRMFCLLLYPQHLEQLLAPGRCSVQ